MAICYKSNGDKHVLFTWKHFPYIMQCMQFCIEARTVRNWEFNYKILLMARKYSTIFLMKIVLFLDSHFKCLQPQRIAFLQCIPTWLVILLTNKLSWKVVSSFWFVFILFWLVLLQIFDKFNVLYQDSVSFIVFGHQKSLDFTQSTSWCLDMWDSTESYKSRFEE